MKSEPKHDAERVGFTVDQAPNRTWLWVIGFFLGALLFTCGAWLARRHHVLHVELGMFRYINDWPERLKPVFLAATILPESLWIGMAAVIVTFALKLYQLAWQLSAAIVGAYGVAYLAKQVIHRPRPYSMLSDVHMRARETDPAFPSGHTLIVTVVILTLWPYLPRGWRWVTLLFIPLMGISRIYLGVHTPLDIVGGFGLGLAIVSCTRMLPQRVRSFLRFD